MSLESNTTAQMSPKIYWTIAAFVLFFASCVSIAIFVSLSPNDVRLSGNLGFQETDPRYRPGGTNCNRAVINQLPFLERLARIDDCREEIEQHRLSSNNLLQQTRAANAAEEVAILAFQQTLISVWSLIFGVWTLAAAILAAVYAGFAAAAARDSLQLARTAETLTIDANNTTKESVNIYREMGERQVRAYLGVGGVSIELTFQDLQLENLVRSTVVVKNFGNSPANQTKCHINRNVRRAGWQGPINLGTEKYFGVLAPSVHMEIFCDIQISNIDIQEIEAGFSALHVWGAVEYVDVFGKADACVFDLASSGKTFKARSFKTHDPYDATLHQ